MTIKKQSAMKQAGTHSPTLLPARYLAGGVLLGSAAAALFGLRAYSALAVRRLEAKYPPIGQFVTADGVRLHYLRQGSGQPVVLLHASGLVLQDFTLSGFDQVAAAYQAIAFDRPGYGYSERPAGEPLTLALTARLIHGALNQLGIQNPILIGHSGGGSVALRYALEYPDAVAGVVLLAPSAYAEGLSAPPLASFTDPPVLGDLFLHVLLTPLVQAIAPQFVAGLFAPNNPPAGYVEMLKAFAGRPSHFRTHADELKHLRAGLRTQSPHYGKITLPVAILAGEEDRLDPPETQAIRLHHALPDAQLVTVAGSGHAVHHQAPELVLAALQRIQSKEAAKKEAA
jgi:pimeloyl-ACP methyl ester carboxylesterase